MLEEPLRVEDFAKELSAFFMDQWNKWSTSNPAVLDPKNYTSDPMVFLVAGFNNNEPYGCVYSFEIPRNPIPIESNKDRFGVNWGGQRIYADRILQGYDSRILEIIKDKLKIDDIQLKALKDEFLKVQMSYSLDSMALQDCVNFAIFLIRTSINALELSVELRGCGGAIDVATITRREGLRFIQKKQIRGETYYSEQDGIYYD